MDAAGPLAAGLFATALTSSCQRHSLKLLESAPPGAACLASVRLPFLCIVARQDQDSATLPGSICRGVSSHAHILAALFLHNSFL